MPNSTCYYCDKPLTRDLYAFASYHTCKEHANQSRAAFNRDHPVDLTAWGGPTVRKVRGRTFWDTLCDLWMGLA